MNKFIPISMTAVLILAIALSGCGGGGIKTPSNSFSITESLVPGAASFPTGEDDSGSCSTVNYPYYIAKTEVTYTLWKKVYDWALSRGYDLNEGKRGGGWSTIEIFFNTGNESHPVTYINWYDAIVWCNALTEYYNEMNNKSLECVYKDSAGNVIRNSKDATIMAYLDNMDDFNRTATGFRLPTSMEWELAARYIDGITWTPGTYASGAAADASNAEATKAVAWYWDNSKISSEPDTYSTHPVGQKPVNGNALGIYDMSGNVWEWCFDKNDFARVSRGGSWYCGAVSWYEASLLQLGVVLEIDPNTVDFDLGFRPVRIR